MVRSLVMLAAAAAVVVAVPAEAKTMKQAKQKRTHVARVVSQAAPGHRGTNLFPAGPLYWNGDLYMGDDPDPFIRSQLWRDVNGRLGGDAN